MTILNLADQYPPIQTHLSDVYDETNLVKQRFVVCQIKLSLRVRLRYANIHDAFVTKFGVPPSFYVRSPGRVNIIGSPFTYHNFNY